MLSTYRLKQESSLIKDTNKSYKHKLKYHSCIDCYLWPTGRILNSNTTNIHRPSVTKRVNVLHPAHPKYTTCKCYIGKYLYAFDPQEKVPYLTALDRQFQFNIKKLYSGLGFSVKPRFKYHQCTLSPTLTLPWIRLLFTGLSLQMPEFAPGTARVRFVEDKMALGQVRLWVLPFSLPVSLHPRSTYSYTTWG
jgi:hypothetical protein